MGVRGWPIEQCTSSNYPSEWLGEHIHTHRAIDDALGYADLLRGVLGELEERMPRSGPGKE